MNIFSPDDIVKTVIGLKIFSPYILSKPNKRRIMLEDKKKKKNPGQKLLASLPSMTVLLQNDEVVNLIAEYPERYVQKCLREILDDTRQKILKGKITDAEQTPDISDVISLARKRVKAGLGNKIMRVINGAGVILHTGLGRAALSDSALDALTEASTRYSLLATDRDSGKRGDRFSHTDELLCELTGAEASLVVNNNSAAVMLALNTFGAGKESIVSRGELVEIGGAFRIPDVMERSGTIMVEVGTTNKTHLRDYRNAITEETSLLLKVHTSNYRIEGFHGEVGEAEMSALAREKNLITVMDLGSGAMVDIRRWGVAHEPTVPQAVKDGMDIITFSGDKMLGGPQCGILIGKKELIAQMKVNPLMRAFRCGKLTLSALNGTLRLFLNPDTLPQTHPVYEMIGTPMDVIKLRAQRLARRLRAIEGFKEAIDISIGTGLTEMGSGSLPARGIATHVVAMTPKACSAENLSTALRQATPPLFTRIEEEQVKIDARTITDKEVVWIGEVMREVLGRI